MKPVDTAKPSTWIKYEPSLCNGCWAGCCTLPVTVSTEDLFHMGYLEAQEVNGPLKEVVVRLTSAGLIQAYHAKTRTFTLRQENGGDCLFLDQDRLCTIYDKRPSVCRQFPENSARPGFCPHRKKS